MHPHDKGRHQETGKDHLSVGVGPNKLIAKIASKFQKPDGLTVVQPEDVQDFIYPLNVSKILGIGEKTSEALKLMGITKVEELANCDIQRLTERFGKMGLWLKQVAHGLDLSEVEESEEAVKSISRSRTFGEDTNDPVKITGYLELLTESVHRALIKDRFLFKVVTLVVRLKIFPHIHDQRLSLSGLQIYLLLKEQLSSSF